MARTARDDRLESRAARLRLPPRGKAYHKDLGVGSKQLYRRLKEKNGRWGDSVYVGNQKYVTEMFADADDFSDCNGTTILSYPQAQAEVRRRAAARAALHTGAGRGPYRVADAMADYLKYLRHDGKSADNAKSHVDVFILPTLGQIEVSALSPEKLRGWLANLADTPARKRSAKGSVRHAPADRSPEGRRRRRASANRVYATLRAALTVAFNEEKVASDAAWRRVRPFKGAGHVRLRFLTADEMRRLINACPRAFRRLVLAALWTGLRYSELTNLVVSDFDAANGTLLIQRSKSGKSRVAYLSPPAAAQFVRWCLGRRGDERLFTRDNGEPWGRSHQIEPMRRACEAARITPPIGFHGLRHSFASALAAQGESLAVIAEALGHADQRMAARYAHLTRSHVAEAVRRSAPALDVGPDDDSVVALRR